MRRWFGACLVLLLSLLAGRAEASDEWRRLCMLGSVADRDTRVAIAPQAAAGSISSVLPDRGLVPFTVDRRWDDGLVLFALVGRVGDTPSQFGNRVPTGAREMPVLHPRASEDGLRTELRIRLPAVNAFSFWPLHRILIIGCRPNAEPVEFVAAVDAPIAAHGTAAAGAMLLVALVLLATAAVRRRMSPGLSFTRSLDPLVIAQDSLGYGSISRLQVLFFSLIVFGLLTYIALRTGVVGAISADILILMGIAAAGTAGAALVGNVGPAATSTPEASASEQGQEGLSPETRAFLAETGLMPYDRIAQWRDLFVARGEIDIFRVQAVVFSLFVGGTLITSGLEQLAAYEIPDTVLGLLGLSQASYVGGKMVFRRPGDIRDVDDAASVAMAALAAVRGGDASAEATERARASLGALRRELALLLEEAVPQQRMEALITAAAREGAARA
jgi:hypothetical protein